MGAETTYKEKTAAAVNSDGLGGNGNNITAETAFSSWANDLGYQLPPLARDEQKHRFSVEDDKHGKKSGQYVFYLDGGGYIKDYRNGRYDTFHGKTGNGLLTPEEIQALEAKRQRRERERLAREKAVAEQARDRWEKATPTEQHPYLTRKNVLSHGLRSEGETLLVPVRDADGAFLSLQTITPDGDKLFLKDSCMTGGLFKIGWTKAPEEIMIVEGYSTGSTVHAATGKTVVVAFNTNGITPVAEILRERHPDALLTIAGDNDHGKEAEGKGNAGRDAAQKAARKVNARICLPDFALDQSGTDWNDYAALHGMEATAEALKDSTRPEAPARARVFVDGPWLGIIQNVGTALAPHQEIFSRAGEIVRLDTDTGAAQFEPLTAAGACSELERFCDFFKHSKDDTEAPTRLHENVTRLLLQAPELHRRLPSITRIADYPMPVQSGDAVRTTTPGYCKATGTFTDPSGPVPDSMSLTAALDALTDLLGGFCFPEQDRDGGQHYHLNAVAYLLSCHTRYIIEPERCPIFYAGGNRPGVGKDYLLGLGPLLTTGRAPEYFPPTHTADETRKRILSVCRAGRRYMIVSNAKGHLSDEALEQAATSNFHTDRVLGKSEELTFPNCAIYAISGNGLSYSEDLARRLCPIELTFYGESIEQREYPHPDLYGHVREHRGKCLGALQTMVKTWEAAGCPAGTKRKASFVRWSETIGGILEACQLPNPINEDTITATPNEEAEHYGRMLEAAELRHGNKLPISKGDLKAVAEEYELFPWLGDLENDRSASTRFGLIVKKMENRRFSGRYLVCDRTAQRPRFTIGRD